MMEKYYKIEDPNNPELITYKIIDKTHTWVFTARLSYSTLSEAIDLYKIYSIEQLSRMLSATVVEEKWLFRNK